MSLKTLEVEIDHGRVIPIEEDTLPEHGRALLTILSSSDATSRRPSLRDFKPSSIGEVLRKYPDSTDYILSEMLSDHS